ncbi:hypothetical protein [Streptomyces sp. KR80]|uniref:hypothetical protein n=1 Tax=Streptomyces sp. KR80 TaxID=3457426 RepID=UPI003FD47000
MRLNASRTIKTTLATAVATSVLAIPAAGSATAATDTTADVTVKSISDKCKHHGRYYIVREYFRGPARYTMRCGTKKWGWKHIKLRHGWSRAMDNRIGHAIANGRPNGRGGYSTYTNQCPSVEKFRTILGTPAAVNDLRTAYKVTSLAAKC